MTSNPWLFVFVCGALILLAAAQVDVDGDCLQQEGSACFTEPSSSSSGESLTRVPSSGGEQAEGECVQEEGSPCSTVPPSQSFVRGTDSSRGADASGLTRSDVRRAERMVQRLRRSMPDFFTTLSDSRDEEKPLRKDEVPDVDSRQCSVFGGRSLSTVQQSSSLQSRATSLHSLVTECRERCFSYTPLYIWHSGRLVKVFQAPFFHQRLQWCVCRNFYCSGRSQCGWWWKGSCVKEYSWKKLLVYYKTSSGLRFKWVKVYYPVGCCCVPWGYGHKWWLA